MDIYIARHGTTEWNRKHKIQGRADIPLDHNGVLMAEMSGKKLKELGITFDHVYSSPLIRAYETARLLCPGQEVITDERLTELHFGQFEGQVTDILLTDPEHPFRFFKQDPVRYNEQAPAYGGESLAELVERTSSFMREVIEPLASTSESVLISGHGALNRGLLMYVRSITDLADYWGMGLQNNCGITKVTLNLMPDGTIRYADPDECRIYYDESLGIDPNKLLTGN